MQELNQLFKRSKEKFIRDGVVDITTRKSRIQSCINLLVDHQQALAEAVREDFGARHEYLTLMSEVMQPIAHAKYALKQLSRWMKPSKRSSPFPMGLFGARTAVHYQPKGVVGIIAPWNYPLAMVINPLVYALAAGNLALVKTSEYTPKTSALLQKLIAEYFPDGEVAVVTGGAEIGAAFSALPFDHLFFTGASHVGKLVMQAAAANLTPVTLELGGKSPVVIGESAVLEDAVEKLLIAKSQNAGQVCVCPDYIFVHESQLEPFIALAKTVFSKLYPAENQSADYTSIIDERNYLRVQGLLDDAKEQGSRIEALDQSMTDASKRLVPITLVINPPEQTRVSQEELFSPVLMLKSYKDIQSCIDYINSKNKPLAVYYFGQDKAEQQRMIKDVFAGGMSINDAMVHLGCVDAPFGGVGHSGMGSYHGVEGFLGFSHGKTVFRQGGVNLMKLAGMVPPFTEKAGKTISGQIKK